MIDQTSFPSEDGMPAPKEPFSAPENRDTPPAFPDIAHGGEAAPGSITASLQRLASEMAALRALVTQQAAAGDLNKSAFDRLHREMMDYKDDFLARAKEPLFRALISLDDDIEKMACQEKPITDEDWNYLRDQLEETLSREGVEPYLCEQELFEPGRQKAVVTEITTDPTQHRRIIRRIRRGYAVGARVVRPEHVGIAIYQKPSEGDIAHA